MYTLFAASSLAFSLAVNVRVVMPHGSHSLRMGLDMFWPGISRARDAVPHGMPIHTICISGQSSIIWMTIYAAPGWARSSTTQGPFVLCLFLHRSIPIVGMPLSSKDKVMPAYPQQTSIICGVLGMEGRLTYVCFLCWGDDHEHT